MSGAKSLYEKMLENNLADENSLVRFAFILGIHLFLGALGFVFEKSLLAAAGFALVPFILLSIVLINGSFYLQDIYEIDDFWKVFDYLVSALFGFADKSLKISGGAKVLKEGEVNTLDRIGGPGILNVEPGNAVVLETLLAPSRILGAGEHKIFRNEIIKEVVNLEEYSGRVPEMMGTTQDGIDVKINDIEYRFRIDQIKTDTGFRTTANPYPFSVRAVYSQAYGRAIGTDGKLGKWEDAVQGMIKGIISETVSSYDLDTLLSPGAIKQHPLEMLREKFYKNRNKFKGVGANLLWINPGSLSVMADDIDELRYKVWSARQTGSAKVMRAQGESESISSRERGRAEGQVILLKSIAQALNDINVNGANDEAKTAKNLWNIVLARTAQILESMTSIYSFEDKEGQNGS